MRSPRTALPFAAAAAALAAAAAAAPAPAPPTPQDGRAPTANAAAWAVRITIPGRPVASVSVARTGTATGSASRASYSYPASGAVVVIGASAARVSASTRSAATAAGTSSITDISVFGGEITADSLVAHASSTLAGPAGPTGSTDGTRVVNLQALGVRRSSGRISLADWGTLTIRRQAPGPAVPEGTKGRAGSLAAVDIVLGAAHGGLPAGSEIQLGYVETAVHTPPPIPVVTGPLPGDRPQLLPPTTGPLVGVPQIVQPVLAAGPYVFPVFGPSSATDDYGVFRRAGGYHHGIDVLGELGQPLVAVADGTVFSARWTRVGGNQLWLRDHAGDEFYYAHLSAFSRLVGKGAHVRAGQVVGFMGTTGDAEGKPTHLHFEVHPVSMLFLGLDGAVDPYPYLRGWRRLAKLAFPVATGWAPKVPGTIEAPPPGALLLGSTDISSVDGLSPAAVRRIGGS